MQRLTFVADDHLAERIRRAARVSHKSVSDVIREKVTKGFEAENKDDRFPFIGMFSSNDEWTSQNLDEYLRRTWADAILSKRDK